MELFSPWHIAILLVVVALLFFKSKQLPDMARSVGRSLRIFKTEIKGMTEDDKAREASQAADQPPVVAPRAIDAAPIVAQPIVAQPIAAQPIAAQPVTRPRPAPRPPVVVDATQQR